MFKSEEGGNWIKSVKCIAGRPEREREGEGRGEERRGVGRNGEERREGGRREEGRGGEGFGAEVCGTRQDELACCLKRCLKVARKRRK